MAENSFSEQYTPGEQLSFQNDAGETIAKAIVLNYDPIHDTTPPSGMSKAAPIPPNHWHLIVQATDDELMVPAALWQRGNPVGTLGPHFTREQSHAERRGETLVSSRTMQLRIEAIASEVASIVLIPKN